MTVILAIKARDGVVLAGDQRVTYYIGNDPKFTSKSEKIIQIGKNTIMGFSGVADNVGELASLLKENSEALDNDMLSALNSLKSKIRKIDLEGDCLLVGKVKGDLAFVKLSVSKENKLLEIALQISEVEIIGDIIPTFSSLNLIIHPYIDYVKIKGESLTVDEAESLAYIAISDISRSGALSIGDGVSIFSVVKNGENINIEEIHKWKLEDLLPTAYAQFNKERLGALIRAIKNINGLEGLVRKKDEEEEKDKAKLSD